MKRIAIILLIGICTLSSAFCRAESVAITHDFDDMVSKGTLTFPYRPSDYSVGVTDLVTYTGSSGGGFGLYSSAFCITLPTGGVIQTSPAVENLTRILVTHTKGAVPTGVRLYISTDNSSWSEITSLASLNSSAIEAPMPSKGNYYLKIVNETASTINFLSVQYTYDNESCHCLRVVSE